MEKKGSECTGFGLRELIGWPGGVRDCIGQGWGWCWSSGHDGCGDEWMSDLTIWEEGWSSINNRRFSQTAKCRLVWHPSFDEELLRGLSRRTYTIVIAHILRHSCTFPLPQPPQKITHIPFPQKVSVHKGARELGVCGNLVRRLTVTVPPFRRPGLSTSTAAPPPESASSSQPPSPFSAAPTTFSTTMQHRLPAENSRPAPKDFYGGAAVPAFSQGI